MRTRHYWNLYHKAKLNDFLKVWKLALEIVEGLGDPWKRSKRGRRPKFTSKKHAAVCIFMKYFGLTYRKIEGSAELLMRLSIDHSTVGWAMKRLPVSYIKKAIKRLHFRISDLCSEGAFIVDSTGIRTDREVEGKFILEKREKKEFLKLHVFVKYFPNEGLVSIANAHVTKSNRHDSPIFRNKLLKPDVAEKGTIVFGDKAYYAFATFEKIYDLGMKPVIPPKNWKSKSMTKRTLRRRALFDYNNDLRKKFRGMIEGVFGGLETEYGNRTRCRNHHTRSVSALLLALSHNLKTYQKALTLKQLQISPVRKRKTVLLAAFAAKNKNTCVLSLIYSTTPI